MNHYTSIIFILFVSISLFHFEKAHGQILILNGNFEEINYCTERKQPCSPSAWFDINNIPMGYRKRTEANHYKNYVIRFDSYGQSHYWQTILGDTLVPGKEYLLTYNISTGSSNLNNYGFLFTDGLVFAACDTVLSPTDFISMPGGKEKILKSGWVHVEKTFIAQKTSRYLVVGNFVSNTNENIAFDLDNVELKALNHKHQLPGSLKDSVYAIKERHRYIPCGHVDRSTASKKNIDTLEIIVIDNLQFALNSYTILNPEEFDKYDSLFNSRRIDKIHIIGYTDSTGSEKYNLNLSKMRAEAVRALLMNRYGLAEQKIEAFGKGVSRDYDNSALNRRVEIKINPEDD